MSTKAKLKNMKDRIVKEFSTRFEKDLTKLQKTIEAEGDQILKKVKKAANDIATNKNIAAKRKEIEQLIEARVKKMEPAVSSFMREVKKSGKKYGINVEALEKKVQTTFEKAKANLGKKGASTTRKKAGTKRAKKTTSSASN